MRRLLVLLFLPLLLIVVSCGGDSDSGGKDSQQDSQSDADSSEQANADKPKVKPAHDGPALDSVQVSGGKDAKPHISFDNKPFQVDKTVAKVLHPGDGEPLKPGEQAEVQYLGVNGRDGKEFDTSWSKGREPLSFQADPQQMIKGFVRGLIGKKVGSRVLVAIPPEEGYGKQGNPQAGIKGKDSLVFVVDLTSTTGQEKKQLAKVDPASADDVEVEGEPGSKPKVSFKQPLKADHVDTNVVNPGDGAKVAKGDRAIVDYVGVLGRNGEEFDASSWKDTANPVAFDMTKDKLLSGFYQGLVGQRVGSRVTVTMPPKQGYGEQGNQQLGVRGTDSLVFVVDIKATVEPVDKASGSKVTPPDSLPKVSSNNGKPSKMSVPKNAKTPSQLTVQPLIKGDGAKVSGDDTVATVHYSAFNWRDGKMFDTSWQGRQDPMTGQPGEPQPLDIPLAGYNVPGLPKALVGQTVGSRVMVVLPPEEGFKSQGGLKSAKVKPDDTTVFVVDILGAG